MHSSEVKTVAACCLLALLAPAAGLAAGRPPVDKADVAHVLRAVVPGGRVEPERHPAMYLAERRALSDLRRAGGGLRHERRDHQARQPRDVKTLFHVVHFSLVILYTKRELGLNPIYSKKMPVFKQV